MTAEQEGFMMEMVNKAKGEPSDNSNKTFKQTYYFAVAQDEYGKYHYFSADSEEAIEKRCKGGLVSSELAILNWAVNVTPIMAMHHFEWIGNGHNPFRISQPHDYKNPNKRPLEKW